MVLMKNSHYKHKFTVLRISVVIPFLICLPVWAEVPVPREERLSTSGEDQPPLDKHQDDAAEKALQKKLLEELKERAKKLLERQQYEPALAVLEQAFEVAPSPLLMFNIAMCEKALSRHLDALRSFHAFFEMQKAEGKANPKLEKMAEDALEDLEPLVSTLEIRDAPNRAEVTVDGNLIGSYPLKEPLYVVPGRHTVTVSSDKGESMTIDVMAAGGAKVPVRADLSTAPSILEVQCNDALAKVYVDGEHVGGCSFQGELEEGEHEILISAPGKKTVVQTITLAPRRTNFLSVDLPLVMQINTPAPTPTPAPPTVNKNAKRLFYTGLAVAVVGGIGLGFGTGFAIAGEIRARDAKSLYDSIDAAQKAFQRETPDESVFEQYERNWLKYDDDRKRVLRLRKGAIIGFAVGGSLLAVGAGLLSYYWVKQKKEGASNGLSIGSTGVEVFF